MKKILFWTVLLITPCFVIAEEGKLNILKKSDADTVEEAVFFALNHQGFIFAVMDYCAKALPDSADYYKGIQSNWRKANEQSMIAAETISRREGLSYTEELQEMKSEFTKSFPDPKEKHVPIFCSDFSKEFQSGAFGLETKLPKTFALLNR